MKTDEKHTSAIEVTKTSATATGAPLYSWSVVVDGKSIYTDNSRASRHVVDTRVRVAEQSAKHLLCSTKRGKWKWQLPTPFHDKMLRSNDDFDSPEKAMDGLAKFVVAMHEEGKR